MIHFLLGAAAGVVAALAYIYNTHHVWPMTREERADADQRAWDHELRCGGMR